MRYYAHIICRKLKRQSEAFDSVGYMKNSKQFFLYSSLDIDIVNVKLHNIFGRIESVIRRWELCRLPRLSEFWPALVKSRTLSPVVDAWCEFPFPSDPTSIARDTSVEFDWHRCFVSVRRRVSIRKERKTKKKGMRRKRDIRPDPEANRHYTPYRKLVIIIRILNTFRSSKLFFFFFSV